ncbi:hypothetical protein HHI36_002495 [Cryptolaemus montrouzieri]|uniref:HTH CENPB-type domain-containing protein n=1 Tax=Cryptolaemus montrouzieri TaxID=559131 RepID=A0ABD2PAU5_9CUCU
MPKLKRVVLSMKDKYEINERLEKGESATKLSNEYQVGKSTITDIKKQKMSINNFISLLDSSGGSTSRKTMKLAANTDLDDAVYKWFTQKRSQRDPISGPILCEKAVQFNKKLGGPTNFQASTGWLKRFKSRHGIRDLEIHREKLSADSFKIKLKDILKQENYDDEDRVYQIIQESEILDLVTNKADATTCASSTTSSDNEDENIIGACQAFTCLEIALRWFETQAESDHYQISVLKKVRDIAASKRVGLLGQTKIDGFFEH